jgi:hypothetical protein
MPDYKMFASGTLKGFKRVYGGYSPKTASNEGYWRRHEGYLSDV